MSKSAHEAEALLAGLMLGQLKKAPATGEVRLKSTDALAIDEFMTRISLFLPMGLHNERQAYLGGLG